MNRLVAFYTTCTMKGHGLELEEARKTMHSLFGGTRPLLHTPAGWVENPIMTMRAALSTTGNLSSGLTPAVKFHFGPLAMCHQGSSARWTVWTRWQDPQYPPGAHLSRCLWMWRSTPSLHQTWSTERGPSCCVSPQQTTIAAVLVIEPLQYLPTKMGTWVSAHKLATMVTELGLLQSKKIDGTLWKCLSTNFMIR